ncbi:MAG: hypothetical protein EON92_02680 [Burkholderiales bacterium]|nr:MAG: hypothetical protein EON92_02680 [Burkholderiales bacterium]
MKLLFRQCSCNATEFKRIPRSLWMRAFPSKRLYYCASCDSKIFTDRDLIVQMAWENTTIKMFEGQVISEPGSLRKGRDSAPAPY